MGHNARKLTQVNKAHKDKSKAKSQPKLKILNRQIKKKTIMQQSKEKRIQIAEQNRKTNIEFNKNSEYSKKGSTKSAPLLCGIFPLFEFKNIDVVFSLLKRTDQNAKIQQVPDIGGYMKINSEDFIMQSQKFKKNFAFTACKNFRDRFDYMDLAKVVDWCLFILPDDLDELIGDYTQDLITCLLAQGFPSSTFITLQNKNDFNKKDMIKNFESITKISLANDGIKTLSDLNDATMLMRHLSQNCKPRFESSKKSDMFCKSIQQKRGYFMIENANYREESSELRVTGYMRGLGVDMESTKFVHITEIGDFELKEVQWLPSESANRFSSDFGVQNLKRYLVDRTNKDEKMNDKNNDASSEEDMSEEEEDIEDDDDEEDEMDDDEEEEEIESDIESGDDVGKDQVSYAPTAHSGFSVAQIQKFKESREESMFPDEVEVAYNEKAREKFRKYRQVKGFKRAEWPLDDNLPDCYREIYAFKKYKHDRNRLNNKLEKLMRNRPENFIEVGSLVEMVLGPVTVESFTKMKTIMDTYPERHFICSNLFVFENNISVLHMNERRLADVDDSTVKELAKLDPNNQSSSIRAGEEANSVYNNLEPGKYELAPAAEPIESKETMLFQIGFRRFSSTPLYSVLDENSEQIGNRGKGKYCRFMELKSNVLVTVYGPVTYGPCPVLQFRIRQFEIDSGDWSKPYVAELVAKGSLISVDPTKPIIKRILLSGQIYKVNTKSVMIRYMFFNTEDVMYFKECAIQTKNNKDGKIIGPHGTHGHMRCYFYKPVSQDEVALLPLYKRIFPKYTVRQMYDYLPGLDQYHNDANVMDMGDDLF